MKISPIEELDDVGSEYAYYSSPVRLTLKAGAA